MTNTDFKKLFDSQAKIRGFESAFGGWFKESSECIVVLDLQKSNYGDYVEMNIKIYIQGMFGNHYAKSKELVKKDIGDVFRRQPSEYDDSLRLDGTLSDEARLSKLGALFDNFIAPFTNKALSIGGINELAENHQITLLPAVKKALMDRDVA